MGTGGGGRTAHSLDSLDGAVLWRFSTWEVPPGAGFVYHDGRPDVAVGTQEWVDLSDVVFVLWGEPPLFADDLETGTTGAWTVTRP